jgi:glycosyltransferase involved in cell wall biosynthesis
LSDLLAGAAEPSRVLLHHAFYGPAIGGLEPAAAVFFHGPWALEYLDRQQSRPRALARRMVDRIAARLMMRIERQAVRGAARLFVASRHMAVRLEQLHGPGLSARMHVAGGGADLCRFQPPADRAALRQRHNLPPTEWLALAVRRLVPRMGLDVLLRAFASVSPQFPQARLWLAGEGPQRDALGALAERLDLSHRVRFLGQVPEAGLPGLLGAADCVIMPSLDLEGFGLVTAEALACGTPVVGSRAGATPELVEALEPRLLFDAGSDTALAGVLRKVLTGAAWIPDRARCAAYARERFSWDGPADVIQRGWDP